MKTLTKQQAAVIKRTAQTINPLKMKRDRLTDKIDVLMEEIRELDREMEVWEEGIKAMTGGYRTSDLVDKVTENGSSRYVLRYPDTIVPPQENKEEEDNDLDSMPSLEPDSDPECDLEGHPLEPRIE